MILDVVSIAEVAYEVSNAYRLAVGGKTRLEWSALPTEEQQYVITGVRAVLSYDFNDSADMIYLKSEAASPRTGPGPDRVHLAVFVAVVRALHKEPPMSLAQEVLTEETQKTKEDA